MVLLESVARCPPQTISWTSLVQGAFIMSNLQDTSQFQGALHRGLAGALLPPSGLAIHLEATCGPFINRVGDSFGRATASLLANIVQTLVSSWIDSAVHVSFETELWEKGSICAA